MNQFDSSSYVRRDLYDALRETHDHDCRLIINLIGTLGIVAMMAATATIIAIDLALQT